MVARLGNLSVGDYVVIAAVLAFVVVRALESLGLSRSTNTVRQENEDLTQRVVTLEEHVRRLEGAVQERDRRIGELERSSVPALHELLQKQGEILERIARSLNDLHLVVSLERKEQA